MPAADYEHHVLRYAQRPVDGTDGLVFRTLEERIRSLEPSGLALDVGCGTGRSTRFLRSLGLQSVGLDVSEAMVRQARQSDPHGVYHTYETGSAFPFPDAAFDLLISTWAVLELETFSQLRHLLVESGRVLRKGGRGFFAANTPEFYSHVWVSCDADFPENSGPLRSGQAVKAHLLPEGIVVHDTFWSDTDYRRAFGTAGLRVAMAHSPLAPAREPGWQDETTVAPYVIYEVEHAA